MKKIIICIITVIIGIIIGTTITLYFYNKNKLIITPIKENIEVYEKVELKDLLEDIELLNNQEINTDIVGEQNIEIRYKNKIFKYKENIKINIIDTEAPLILVNNVWLEEDKEIDLVNNFLCADNYDNKPNCYIEGNYDFKTPGEYNLKYIAVDSSNNKTEKNFTLTVYKKPEPVETKEEPVEESYVDFQDIIKIHKNESTKIGIDVSKWQGNIDFEKIKKAGCEFVIIKAAGSYIDGELYTDPKFIENIENALKNNLKVGVYFNSDANSIEKAKQEIEYTLNLIKDYNIELGIAYDWENFTNFNTFNISLHTLNEMANTFLEEAKNNNYNPILYSSKYYLENIWNKNYPIWVAQYADNNTYEGDYIMWQQCSDGKIDGINGYVDIDIMYK